MRNRRIHGYAASFGNDLARSLLSDCHNKGYTVLDPFAGSGTTLVEALSAGCYAVGMDVDPIAALICRTLTRKYSIRWLDEFQVKVEQQLDKIESALLHLTSSKINANKASSFAVNGLIAKIPDKDEVIFWFSKTQRIVLASLTAYWETIEDPKQRDIFATSISSAIIHKWPNTLSKAMDIDHSRPHKASPPRKTIREHFNLFRGVFRNVIIRLRGLVSDSENWLGEATILEGDCLEKLMALSESSIDLILTSPPYVNAIVYPRAHKFSEWWLSPETNYCRRARYIGLRGTLSETEILPYEVNALIPKHIQTIDQLGLSNKNANLVNRYIHDMDKFITGCKHVLKNNGKIAFVLADNNLNGKPVPVVNIIVEILDKKGLRNIHVESRIIDKGRRRYPFVFKGVMTEESIITAEA